MTGRIAGDLAWRRGLSIGEQEGEGAAEGPPVPPPSEAATHDLPSGRIEREREREGREREGKREREKKRKRCQRWLAPGHL